ncbi:MAG: ABC transporter permease [Clostridiales bacterium]|nr:ABC transporter permease [Clostridiales bacterium]
MWKYILKKLVLAVPVLLGITIIDYAIMSLAGSPLDMLAGPRITQGSIALRAERWGLDQPVWRQYLTWLSEVLRGNLGYSYKSYQPVSELIGSHIGPTLLLMGASSALGFIVAIAGGVYSAVHRYKRRDYAVVSFSFVLSSIPGFFLSLVLIYLFTVRLGWLPSGGMSTAGTGGGVGDVARHMVMPSIVLAAGVAGTNIRYIRSSMLEIMEMDYLRTAAAKGIGRRNVIRRHAFRNALLPIVTVVGMQIPALFGGAIIVEQLFAWPGLGLITMSAVTGRDYPVIMGVCLLTAVVVLATNLLTDIVYALVDPTIKYS